MLYNNVEHKIISSAPRKIVFACDSIYFMKYAKYLLKSCEVTKQPAHVHLLSNDSEIIRVAEEFCQGLNIECSLSVESFDHTTYYVTELSSYYFMARYFSASDLFNNFNLEEAIIVDSDIMVKKIIQLPENKNIAFMFRPNRPTLFQQSNGNLFCIKKERLSFIEKMIKSYKIKFNNTDWESIDAMKNRSLKKDSYGLDQVCISEIAHETELLNDSAFLNFKKKVASKSINHKKSLIWTFTGIKSEELDDQLKELSYEKVK